MRQGGARLRPFSFAPVPFAGPKLNAGQASPSHLGFASKPCLGAALRLACASPRLFCAPEALSLA